ncbi:S-adenosyl-L-methionine-dependent methyltransferase [Saccharata proteae CBS 121410]|uniref:S-adenosyl-L-methionine-dependent methyltransferase n=1 Tax=Saccharata proteae CBS 121410 TaxID=1314787 RepID=A0A9P4HWM3_9PEZI|nr:S-adenosyl-L-methionine-dependent methyltransferase [Saccharata proteae CBS 121410]
MADQVHVDDHVEVDIENDSAVGDDAASFATSLSSDVEKYRQENGRRFHAYREGAYNFPNDEREQDRLDMVHQMQILAKEGKLFLAPLEKDPKRILDLGTGTGIWAIEAADAYPKAEVIGNDLSPIQPRWVPPNVFFEVDDVESEWPSREPFDLVHVRYLAGSIADWPKLMRNCYNATKPGGWAEFADYEFRYYSEDGSEGPDNQMVRLAELLNEGCDQVGRTVSPGTHLKGWMEEAGFKNVEGRLCKLPMGAWAKDERMKQIGAYNYVQTWEGLEAFVLAVYTRVLGWTAEEVQVFLARARQDLKRKEVHLILNFWVAYGQRPVEDA